VVRSPLPGRRGWSLVAGRPRWFSDRRHRNPFASPVIDRGTGRDAPPSSLRVRLFPTASGGDGRVDGQRGLRLRRAWRASTTPGAGARHLGVRSRRPRVAFNTPPIGKRGTGRHRRSEHGRSRLDGKAAAFDPDGDPLTYVVERRLAGPPVAAVRSHAGEADLPPHRRSDGGAASPSELVVNDGCRGPSGGIWSIITVKGERAGSSCGRLIAPNS